MTWLELRVPPLAVLVACAAVQFGIAKALPALHWPARGLRVLAIVLAVVGLAVCGLGVFEFRRSATTVDPTRPANASSIVASGIFRYSRNPMYLGFALLLVAWSAWLQNVAGVAVAAFFVAYLTRFQVLPEERALVERFGSEYAQYRERVRRWL